MIADASRPGVVQAAVARAAGSRDGLQADGAQASGPEALDRLRGRSGGHVTVDEGARPALVEREASLLPAGVVAVKGRFYADDAVEIAGPDGNVFAKGLVRHDSVQVASWAGRRSSELPDGVAPELVHRDDLVVIA